MSSRRSSPTTLPTRLFKTRRDWASWLGANHGKSPGVWLQLAKKVAGVQSVSYDEAIEVALCFGWIDGQKQAHDEQYWLQRFTPRSRKSAWSKINKAKALALIEAGKMEPAGLLEVERARKDGRWGAAYDSASTATVPDDFQAALDGNSRAREFFDSLDGRNRYAVLYRIQTVKMAATRERKIAQFLEMLARHEKVHP